jgi:molybdate transport system substrate-binding protein
MHKTSRLIAAAVLSGVTMTGMAHAEDVKLIAAGSLKAALGDVAKAFTADTGKTVSTTFGPSGLMREKIDAGEEQHVFASANMKHPRTLNEAGKAGEVKLFARNKLCALAAPGVNADTASLLEAMLNPEIKLGTSTPKADPSGDYAFQLFDKAEALKAGSTEQLKAKALQLTGGETSHKAPEGRFLYAWVVDSGQADIFLTYCTNAVLAKRDNDKLQIIAIQDELAVGADYGLTVINGAPAGGQQLADYILGEKGQSILAGYGFEPETK